MLDQSARVCQNFYIIDHNNWHGTGGVERSLVLLASLCENITCRLDAVVSVCDIKQVAN